MKRAEKLKIVEFQKEKKKLKEHRGEKKKKVL